MSHKLEKESLDWASDLHKELDLKLVKLLVGDVRTST